MLKHKYSQRYRKIRQDFSSVLVRELGPDELNQYAAQMEALYKQVTEKQLVRMGTINRNFFSGMHEALGEQYKVCGFFLEGELIAFSSALLHEASYDMNYIGMDYRYNTTHHLYFNLLYHCLEQAIRYQKPCLILGRTALEAKAILGCVPDYRWSYYQIRHPLLRGIFHQVSRLFRHNQGEGWKSRHPFKSAYYKVGSDSGNSV